MEFTKQDLIRIHKGITDLMQELVTYSDDPGATDEMQDHLNSASDQLSDAQFNVDKVIKLVT